MIFGDFKIHVCKFSLKPDSNRICFAEILSEFCRSWRESQIIAGSQCISINFYILPKKEVILQTWQEKRVGRQARRKMTPLSVESKMPHINSQGSRREPPHQR